MIKKRKKKTVVARALPGHVLRLAFPSPTPPPSPPTPPAFVGAKCNCLANTPLCLFRDGQIGDRATSSPLRAGFSLSAASLIVLGLCQLWFLEGSSCLTLDMDAPLTLALLALVQMPF